MVSSLKVKEDFLFSLSLLLKFSRVLSLSLSLKENVVVFWWCFLCCCSRNQTGQIVVVADGGRARNRDDDNKCDQW